MDTSSLGWTCIKAPGDDLLKKREAPVNYLEASEGRKRLGNECVLLLTEMGNEHPTQVSQNGGGDSRCEWNANLKHFRCHAVDLRGRDVGPPSGGTLQTIDSPQSIGLHCFHQNSKSTFSQPTPIRR